MARKVTRRKPTLKTASGWERVGRIIISYEVQRPRAFWVSHDGWTKKKLYSIDQTLTSENGRTVTPEDVIAAEADMPRCEARYATSGAHGQRGDRCRQPVIGPNAHFCDSHTKKPPALTIHDDPPVKTKREGGSEPNRPRGSSRKKCRAVLKESGRPCGHWVNSRTGWLVAGVRRKLGQEFELCGSHASNLAAGSKIMTQPQTDLKTGESISGVIEL